MTRRKGAVQHTPIKHTPTIHTNQSNVSEMPVEQGSPNSPPISDLIDLDTKSQEAIVATPTEEGEQSAVTPTSAMAPAVESLLEQMASEFKARLRTIFDEAMANPSAIVLESKHDVSERVSSEPLVANQRETNTTHLQCQSGHVDSLNCTAAAVVNEQLSFSTRTEVPVEQTAMVNRNISQSKQEVVFGAQTGFALNTSVGSSQQNLFDNEVVEQAKAINTGSATPFYAPAVQTYGYYKLIDLPTFSGDPLEWPMFERTFVDTTAEFGYSFARNVIRLRQALTGEARAAVQSMLPFPDSVNEIMATLKENFGRPEQLVNVQMANVRKLPALQSGDFSSIVSFSNALKNMTSLIKYARAEYRLCDATLLNEFVSKLPCEAQLQWAEYKENLKNYATIEDLSAFLAILAKRANAVKDSLPRGVSLESSRAYGQSAVKGAHKKHAFVSQVANVSCVICKNACNGLAGCAAFAKLTVNERWDKVREFKLCFSCLKSGHGMSRCYQKKKCLIENCGKRHHKLLHKTWSAPKADDFKQEVVYCGNAQNRENEVWFQVVPVQVRSSDKIIKTFAFLDPGSSHSMIEGSLAEQLGVSGCKETLAMHWLNGIKTENTSELVAFEICGLEESCVPIKMSRVYTVQEMNLPTQSVDFEGVVGNGKYKTCLTIKYENAQPQIIIGLDNAKLITPLDKPVTINKEGSIAMRTKLGWVVYGPCGWVLKDRPVFVGFSIRKQLNDLELLMKNYFSNDDIGVKYCEQDGMSAEDRKLVQKMENTSTFENGRFKVQLLWKKEDVVLPNNYAMALRRFEIIQRKMKQNSQFAEEYTKKIQSYLEKGYAKKLSFEEAAVTSKKTFYLPHFAVVTPNKVGIRVVFDAAAESNGCSLNKNLLAGPDLNQPLISVLLKFRKSPIAVVADIKEMFLQVAVYEEDQDTQRFLWADEDGLSTYKMTRLVFGATCSPTLAQFAKNKNARIHADQWPQAADAVINRHYVDDYVDCFEDESQAVDIVQKVVAIHRGGGFELRNFASNSETVLQTLRGDLNSPEIVKMTGHDIERVLGMHWECKSDVFTFVFKCHKVRNDILELQCIPTKREVLSIIMSVFDPFGLVANFMVMGKLIMQDLWKNRLGWDEKLSPELFETWKIWIKTLALLKEVKVPRCFSRCISTATNIQLHIFCDASEKAMAAVAYLRVVSGQETHVSFVFAKSRCAPLKYTSIPRLELQAALMAVRLQDVVLENIGFEVNSVHFWTDSMTVLHWIQSDSRLYKQYVANRLGEIRECSQPHQWHWIPSACNVADDCTRINPAYNPNSRWISGPEFLRSSVNAWPTQPQQLYVDESAQLEKKTQVHLLTIQKAPEAIEYARFSSFSKLRRVMAWVRRFINNIRIKSANERLKNNWLDAEELKVAEKILCLLAQQECFQAERTSILGQKDIRKTSSLLQLNPKIDQEGLMRVDGRLRNATCLTEEEKCPIILPKAHILTFLLVGHFHVKFGHQNRNTVMCEVRRNYWVPSLRVLMKSVEANCSKCKIRRAKPQQPIMGMLPIDRLTPYVRPFSYSGLDYFGPLWVSVRRQREKRWVALFTCLTTRAVHLELAADLTSDACLLAIRNFVNRRGVPIQIRSDNGTNFVGLKKELASEHGFMDINAVAENVSNLGIHWKFNCPDDPAAGGAWERLVQSVKKVLLVLLRETAPRVETLISVFIEVENIVNSRPLTHLPLTAEEQEPLTPNHFLLNSMNSTQTPAPFNEKHMCLRKQWRMAQNLKNGFWHRWVREYLPDLVRRTKWCQPAQPMTNGDLVLICDSLLPRSEWRRGKIVRLIPGIDGVARTAEVQTSHNVLKRPISKLAKLDVLATKE